MLSFHSNSLKTQIIGVTATALLLIFAIFWASKWWLNQSVDQLESVLSKEVYFERLALQANVDFKRQVQEWKNVLIRGHDQKNRELYWQQFNDQANKVQATVRELSQELKSYPDLKEVADNFLQKHLVMGQAYQQGFKAYQDSAFNINLADQSVRGIDRDPSEALEQLAQDISALSLKKGQAASERAKQTFSISMIAITVSLLLILGLSTYLTDKMVVGPLLQVLDGLKNLVSGNLTHTVNEGDYRGEVRYLADNVEFLRGFIKKVIDELDRDSKALVAASSDVSSNSKHVLNGVKKQQELSSEMSSASDEIHLSANAVTKLALKTSEAMDHSIIASEDGAKAISEASQTMNVLVSEITNASGVIEELAKNSSNVGAVLDVIKGIAEQTNLLALNAAIEAARAGDQGRGFAVVADEVRTLAQKTQQSTEEIQIILGSVQTGALKAVDVMEHGQSRTEEGVKLVTQANDLMSKMVESINHISHMNAQIVQASEEQCDMVANIAKNISYVSSVANETSEDAMASRQVALKLKALGQSLTNPIEHFRHSSN